MVPILPNEIIIKIIECAAFQDKIDDFHHTYAHWILPNICLVSKRFYSLAAPLLYSDIIIRTGFPISELVQTLVPLLSREQRYKLGNAGYNVLIDHERMVNPLWVRRLILLEAGFSEKTSAQKALLWSCIEEAVQGMDKLQFICWEPRYRSPRLARKFHELPRLLHVTCHNIGLLFPPSFPLVPLKSISLYDLSGLVDGSSCHKSLREIIQVSSNSLKKLNLSFKHIPSGRDSATPPEAGSTFSKVFETSNLTTGSEGSTIHLSHVQDLLLTGHAKSTIETLTKVIDFSRLTFLQLAGFGERGCIPQVFGQCSLPSLRKLSVCIVPSSVVDVLNRCENLEEIHVVYENYDPQELRNPTLEVLGAVLRHGRTLTALTLHGTFRQYPPVNAEGFIKLVNGCPKIEDLRVNPDFFDWSRIVNEIPKLLSLKHLCLDMIVDPDPPLFTIEGQQMLTCHGEPWWGSSDDGDDDNNTDGEGEDGGEYEYEDNDEDRDEDGDDEHTPASQLSELDKAVGQLLEASVNHAVSLHNKIQGHRHDSAISWRRYSKLRAIKISAQGLNPNNCSEILSQGYLLREGEPVYEFEEQYSLYHGTRWLAPVGHLYSYNALGVSISLQTAESLTRYAPSSKGVSAGVSGKWDTAFKPASRASEHFLQDLIRMH